MSLASSRPVLAALLLGMLAVQWSCASAERPRGLTAPGATSSSPREPGDPRDVLVLEGLPPGEVDSMAWMADRLGLTLAAYLTSLHRDAQLTGLVVGAPDRARETRGKRLAGSVTGYDAATELLEIEVRTASGLAEGDRLDVVRGERFVGTIELFRSLGEGRWRARLTPVRSPRLLPQAGDALWVL